jgi:hypothetical protein
LYKKSTFSWAVVALICFFSPLHAEDDLYEVVKPGMTLREFNRLEQIPLTIKPQKAKRMMTSYGVANDQTSSQSKYFNLKKDDEWQGGIIRYQNNKIQRYSLFNKKATPLNTGNLLRRLMGRFENKPTYHSFRSFGKEGICFSWEQDGYRYNFNCTNKKDNWFYQIDISKAKKQKRNALENNSPKVIAMLNVLGIKDNSDNQGVASQGSEEDDLLDLLQ